MVQLPDCCKISRCQGCLRLAPEPALGQGADELTRHDQRNCSALGHCRRQVPALAYSMLLERESPIARWRVTEAAGGKADPVGAEQAAAAVGGASIVGVSDRCGSRLPSGWGPACCAGHRCHRSGHCGCPGHRRQRFPSWCCLRLGSTLAPPLTPITRTYLLVSWRLQGV